MAGLWEIQHHLKAEGGERGRPRRSGKGEGRVGCCGGITQGLLGGKIINPRLTVSEKGKKNGTKHSMAG